MRLDTVKHEGLHVLRGISMLLVLLTHLSLPSTILSKISKQLVNPFYWGAELFLMLSGFLITQSIIYGHTKSIRVFLVKRIFRIYPPLIIYMVLAFVTNFIVYNTIPISNSNKFIILIPNEFFYNSIYLLSTFSHLFNHDLGYHYSQMWSVVIEVQYYVFIAFIGILLFRKYGEIVLTTIYIIFLCLVFLVRISNGFQLFWLSGTFLQYLVNMNVDFIAVGGLLAVWWSKRVYLDSQPLGHSPRYITAATGAACIILMFLPSPLGDSPNRYFNHIFILFIAVYIFTQILTYPIVEKNIISSFFLYLGDISYSIYLYHFTIFVMIWWVASLFIPFVFYKTLMFEITQLVGLVGIVLISSRILIAIERKSITIGYNLFLR